MRNRPGVVADACLIGVEPRRVGPDSVEVQRRDGYRQCDDRKRESVAPPGSPGDDGVVLSHVRGVHLHTGGPRALRIDSGMRTEYSLGVFRIPAPAPAAVRPALETLYRISWRLAGARSRPRCCGLDVLSIQ